MGLINIKYIFNRIIFFRRTFLIILAVILCLSINTQIPAASEDFINKSSKALVGLKILRGDEKGNLKLDSRITRCEFVALVNRMMAYDENEVYDSNLTFTDVKESHWAYDNIKTAINYGLIKGYTDNTFKPDNFVTYVEAQAVILRALGYERQITKSWPEGVIEKTLELNLNKNLDLDKDKQLNRGEASLLIYNALTIDFNNIK